MEISTIQRRVIARRKRRTSLLRYLVALVFVGIMSLDLGANASEIWDAGEMFLPERESVTVEISAPITAEIIGETVIHTVYVNVPAHCPTEDAVIVPVDFPSEYQCRNFDDLVMEYLQKRMQTWDYGLEILLAELRVVPDMELLLGMLEGTK